jgi:hypothetical protein
MTAYRDPDVLDLPFWWIESEKHMRIIKLAFAAMFAVLAFAALSSSALAAQVHPIFLTENKAETLFEGSNPAGTTPTLRALNLGVLGTITCEKFTVDGFALNKSSLAHRVKVTFTGKCKQKVGTSESTCVEPIAVKTSLAELGLVLGNKTVGIFLEPSNSTVFATPECPAGTPTTVEGSVIGEIPAISQNGKEQYNKQALEQEQVFESVGKNSENQNPETIELLGVSKKAELKVSGFFGGKASQEATAILKSATGIEVCTLGTKCP